MRRILTALMTMLTGCGASVLEMNTFEQHGGDDTHGSLSLEAEALIESLDAAGVSKDVAAPAFSRLGLMWEAPDPGSIEVRVRADGSNWSDWLRPTVVHSEEGLHAG